MRERINAKIARNHAEYQVSVFDGFRADFSVSRNGAIYHSTRLEILHPTMYFAQESFFSKVLTLAPDP